MIGKNNKYLRDTKGGVKVESYSIKKFKVGAASVVIGASIFFGAGIANAGEVVEKNTEIEKLEGANDKVSPDKEVLKSAKEEVKPAKKEELASGNTPAVNNNVNTEKTVEKQALDKTKLQTNIEKVEELLEKINKDKAPASTLAAIKIDLENAKNALNNNELTQAEVDAVAKKLNEKIFVLSSMPKANTPEKVVKEGKNSIANSGSRDSRNNQRMGEGVRFRADDTRVEGPLYDVKEYISEDKYNGGGTTTNQRVRTIEKTFMTAKYSTEGNKKFITYEVYFQNDGKALDGTTGNAFWFYPPRDLLYNVGRDYPIGVVSDAYYERYEKKAGTTGILSHNPNNFTQVGGRYTVSLSAGKTQDYGSQSLWGSAGGIFQFDGGPARRSPSQVQSMLKNLKDNKELNSIIRLGNGNLPDGSYSHILNVSPKQNYAYKYHVKMRLRDDVTAEQARTAGTIAVTTKAGSATNALQAYVYAATGTSLLAPPTINTLTKYDGTLVSTDRVISGTGVAGATITLTMQDGTSRTIHVDNSGRWSYTLKQNEKLTQNTRQDASIKSPNTISAKQTKNGEESSATAVNVQLARAISIDTPLQAGRDISVKVAHDTGRFYIQVRNAANTATVYEYGVIQENGRWRIENSTAANAIDVKVTDGDTPSEKKITLHVNDSHRKNNIPFKITKDHVVRVRSHHVNDANIAADPGHENDGWVTANKATNTNPTIAIKDSNATYTSDGTLTKDKLKTLVTVNDAEDTPGKTVGNTAAENLDVTATKDGKNVDLTKPLKQGTYNLTYRTIDAAGAIATKNHTITVNYAAVAKSKINLVQGERVSDEIKRSLLELRDGNDKVAIPNNARVEVALDTSAKADSKTAVASVVLQGKTIASTNINYRVLPTFPIAHTVYDFKGVNRSDDESKYYLNTGIPGGMKWFAKRGNEVEIDASGLRDKINADPVGETTYKFGGKYNYGRFTDSPQPNEKLEHAATFTHKVFDIKPNDTKVTVAQGGTLSEAQAISAVAKVTGSPDLPSGTTYEWVDDRGNKITPTANTAGVQNFKVKVTLPQAQSGNDAPEATKRQPSKIITVPVNVTPPAPTVTTEPRYSGTLVSTDRSISGRGIAGATITVALQDGTTGTTLVNNQGEWTYNLKTNEKLTQNTKKDASIKADKEISVKQSKDGVESSATLVNVQLARVISINTPVQAGREITVKVPHDAGQFYVQLNYDTRQVYEYGVKQENGQWKITDPNKANTTELIVKNGDNVSEKELTLRIKDSNKKTNIPFTIPSGENKLRVRVHYVNGQNNPANPANEPGQGWVIASEATNESPTITVKEPRKTDYTADGSLTMAGLKKLVTVADKEDDADKTVGNRASDNFTLTVKQGANVVDLSNNKYLKKGTYTLTYTTRDAAGVTARKEHTITVSSLAESKGASITYPADTAKVVYGNSDVENGNFKPATKQTFANKLTEVNRGNNNLPTINGTGVTFTPGTTNDKEKVVVATFPDGSTLDISHAKVAKPAAPTITPTTGFGNDLSSTERSISGTGIAGATVKIDLQGKTVEATVGSDGNWTYNLKANEVLTQNFMQNANTKSTNPVSVKQVMYGIESTDTTANVQLSDVITFDEPLQAGRDITLRVPHDAGRFYVVIASKEGHKFQYGINKTANGWQVDESVNDSPTGKTRTELTVSTTSNPAERVFKLHIKDSNQKTDIPFTMKADARSVMARVHYDNSRGNPAAGGNWTYTTPINTPPRITVNAPDTRNYTADGSLTLDGLKRLVTVADTEDDANKTVGRTANENLSVTIRQGNKVVNLANNGYLKKGEYTLTYTTTDAAGVSVTKEHTITVSSIPEVSIKAAKDATAQGIVPTTESNKVINSVTIPSNQPQPISKVLKDNGRITEVDGEKVATVVLTYSDNSTKEVTVPVLEVKPIDIVTTFNEKDNTVTIKPNTTVEINDRLQFGIRGKSMALTKTASGYTNSVNDRTITVNQDGSITITLVGEEKFQAGDRIVTRHESNKNGKVDSYETEAFAGLKPVEKVPVINLMNLTPKEKEDVKAAVKKANPSVNTAELEVAANGDVTYRHKGAGVGTSDPTPVITLSQTVRERNDAEKIDPTIVTLTRYVKETKHTDEQIKNAITGEHIANKVITGEIPTNGGTVVVKVTYTDGSSEEVKVPIIVTPELTPVKNLNDLTNNEKESVKAKIQTLNPTATNIVVKNNGETTLIVPDGTTATLTPDKTVVEAQSNAIADPAKTPVVKLTELTTEEKEKVKAEIKKVNPNAKTVEVSDNGTATVTFKDDTTATLTPDKTVVEAQSNAIADPAKTPVVKLTELTTEEKEKVKAEIKKVNPNAKTVEVSDNGTATVTFKDDTTATLTPDKTVVEAQSNAIADPAKTPVVKLTELTTEEKEKVKAEIKKVNPNAKTVEVSDNGTATVTFKDDTTATLTPDKTVVEAQSNAIADPAKTPVVKLTELTTEEKEKVKAEIKKVNPNAKTVEVSDNGTATVTFKDDTTATLTPDKTVVEAQSNAIADPAKTPVVKLTELTTEEKEKVKAEIKKVNPNAKTVEVSDNGTATVTFKDDTTATLTPDKTVVEAQSNAIADPAKTPVVKLTELTTEEKEKVKAEIKKVNPNAKTVEVSDNGTATVTFKDDTTATLTPDKTVVEAQSNAIADPAKTPVVKLTELTTEEKEKVKAEIKKVNPNAKTVEVSDNGTATVTFKDDTTATLTPDKTVVEAQSNAIADPAKTPVVKLTELTTEEKEKVKAEIKKVNPNAKTVEVSDNGTATVTFKDDTTATLTPDKTVVEAQSNAIADPAKTPVVKLTELTTEEKEKVKAEIKKVNPNAKTVEVSDNGTATVTFKDDTTATLTPDKTVVEAQSNAIADPAKTPVVKLTELTTEEKEKVKAEIKKVNPNAKTVEVSDNGTATVTFKDDTTATLTPDKTVVEAQSNAIADPAKTPVVKLTELTTEEKEKVKAEIKKVNPNAKTVEVSDNGTATVTFKDDTTATLTPDKTVVEAQSNAIADPAKTPVVKLTELTTEEKEKVKAEIKKVNPNAKTVEVSDNGTATVTFKDDTTATLTPDKTVVEAQSNAIADPAKTPVVKLTELTTEEKEKVKAEIKKVNPNAKTVEVSDNGTATVTFKDDTTATLTPDKTVVEAQSNAIADPAKTPVVKLTELTTEEKEKVKAEIKKVNPNAKTVEVSDNGTATVTFKDDTTATLTPDKTVVEAQSNAIADPAKTPVVKLTELTTEEKEKVKAEIKKVNPNAKTVEVSDNGTATVTFKDDTTATLTPDKTVVEAQSNAIADPAKTPVVKLTELTTEEKEKVKAEIKKVNPNAKTVEVSDNGTATVTFKDDTTATLTPDKTVVEAQSNAIADPAKTPVVKLTELTTEEKEKVKAEIKKVNPNAKTVEVSDNGTATVTFKDDTTATLTPDKTVVEAQSNAIADPAKTPVVKLTELTTEEKEKVKAEIKKVNPNAKTVEVSDNGTATVTFKDDTTATLTPDKTVVEAQSNAIADPAKTPVVKLTELTTEEKEKVKAEIKKVNPNAKTVEVSDNGTATVTFKDDTTATLTPDKTVVEAQSNAIADPAKTPVVKLTELTTEEKEKVKAEIKKVNPNAKTVEVSDNGTATVTFKDDTTATLTPDKTVVEAQSNAIADPAKTPVVKLTELTTEEKEKVKAEIKKVNPNAKTVEVSDNGTATVTFKDDTTATLTPDKTVVEAQSNAIADPAKTPVVKLTELTTEEKEKVKAEIKKVNPNAKTVEVSDNGTATVTFKDDTTATLTPDKTVVEAQSNAIADPAKTPVVKLTELTTEEKEKVKAEIKKVNPNAKTVEVSDNGTATVTFKDDTTATLTPDKTVVEAQSNAIADPAKTPVVKLTELTTEEKEKVKAEIKKVNPNAKTVEVSDNGTATVTFKDDTTATLTPDKTVVEAQSNAIADPAKTPVVKLTELTTEEKEKVKAEIKKVNPNAKTVEVSDNGTATVTFKDDTTATLTPDKTVVEAQSNAIADPAKTPVVKLTELTTEEKEKVKAEIKKVNPNAKTVEVSDNGTATVTFKDDTTATLTPDKTVVEAQSNAIADPAKTPVVKLTELTTEEKEKVKAEIKKVNPNAKTVEVSDNGTATVTFKDDTTATLTPDKTVVEAQSNAIADPAKTPVVKLTELTTEEKEKVKAEIKKVNPNAKTVEVSDNGTATVTFKDDTTATLTPDKTVVEAQSNAIADPAKTPVVKLTELTTEEKEKVKAEIKKVNPNAKTVEVSDNGTATVTFKDDTTATLTPDKTVVEDFEPVKPTEKVPVKDKAHLTSEEKKQVADKVKDKNPGKEVTVGDDGTATVTDPTTGISHTIPGTDLVNQDFEPVKPTEKVPVKDKAHLTSEEKKQVADKVKDKNPGKEVTVGDDGTATVTDPTTGISHTIPGTDLVNQDFEPVKPTEKVLVKDKAHLTPEEKKQVADKVKDKNPGKEVTVGDDGTATVTDPTTGISHTIPGTDLVNQDFEPVKPTEKVLVKDKAHLTLEEKKQVADKVKDKNPGKEVTVGDDGTATVTDPTTGISHTIPGTDLVNQDFEPVKPTEKVLVKDKAHLTPEEKKQVADKVKDKNPGKEVTVGDDGTATVTDPTTGISHTIPGTDLVNQDFEPVKPTEKVLVKDKAHLTPEEKKQVADKVKDKNPGKEVTVGDDGTATVTDPTTGISHTIPGTDLVNQDFEPVKPTEKVLVKDKAHLTLEEKKQVADKVKDKNPGKEVTVGDDGTATVTDPTTGISHTIPGTDLTIIVPPVVDIPEFNGAVNGELPDPVELPKVKLIITKWADEQGNELKPADAKTPSKLGEPNEAYEHGTIPGYEFVRTEINSDGDVVTHIFRKVTPTSPKVDENIKPKSTAKVEKSTKRLANTGESETNTGLAGLGLAVLGSLLAIAKRRREDEE